MAEVTEIYCANQRCKKLVTLQKPVSEIVHGNNATIVLFIFGDPQRCQHCGQAYIPALQEIQGINFVWRPVVTKADPLVVRSNVKVPSNTNPLLSSKDGL